MNRLYSHEGAMSPFRSLAEKPVSRNQVDAESVMLVLLMMIEEEQSGVEVGFLLASKSIRRTVI